MTDFAKNLRAFRKRKNYTQEELAKKINYGYTAIANYESGRNEPSLDVLAALAELLDVTMDELLGVKLKTEEKQLIAAFRRLDAENKKKILDLIYTLQG